MRSLSGLRYWRLKARFSQKQLAALLEVAPQTISEWERGRAHPRYQHLLALLRVLKVPSLDALFAEHQAEAS